MQCLTLWQPWASLIAVGQKNYETRSWRAGHGGLKLSTAIPGWIAVHARPFGQGVLPWLNPTKPKPHAGER